MKFILVIIFINLITSTLPVHAQYKMVVHEDKRIQILTHQRDSIIVCFPAINKKKVMGYRILVSVTENRDAAYQLKHTLQTRYTGYGVYMSYQTPYFKMKIGDFLLKEIAETFNAGLSRDIKMATTVIPDKIYKPEVQEQLCPESYPLPMYVKASTKRL